ncbi:unnamed protein product, partial [Polarella glacialis]
MLETLLRKNGLRPDIITGSSCLVACGRGLQWDFALGFLSRMRASGIFPPCEPEAGVPAVGALLGSCTGAGRWQQALSLWGCMLEGGVKPDLACRNDALSALAGRGAHWRAALHGHDQLAADGFRVDVIALNTLLATLAASSSWRRLLVLLENAESRAQASDSKTFCCAVFACARARQPSLAVGLLQEAILRFEVDVTAVMAATSAAPTAQTPSVLSAVRQPALSRLRAQLERT